MFIKLTLLNGEDAWVNIADISRFYKDKDDCGEVKEPTIIVFTDSDAFIWVLETPNEVAGMIADEVRLMNAPPIPSPFMP